MAEPIHNQFPPNSPESSTTPRYSLSYELIGSTDTIVRHVSGHARIVTYEKSDERSLKVRDALAEKGLILGENLSGPFEKMQNYRVPQSARPIAYDARVMSAGAFSYNDEQLFFDLGNLLGNLYTAVNENSVVVGDIGHAIAFVEFTEPDERQLYFVPGVEKMTETLAPRFNPLIYYAERLSTALEERFEVSESYFRMGFLEATQLLEGEQ